MSEKKNKKDIETEDVNNMDQTIQNDEREEKHGKGAKRKGAAKGGKGHVGTKQLQEKINELEKSLADLNDKYLRLFSEFDNYRKRTNKERLELIKSASEEIIVDLLPVIDDFERGIKSMESHDALKTSIDGVKLIYNKMMGILKKKGLEPIESIGKPFDTDFHEALTNIPAPSEDLKGKVVDEIEKGYLLNGKVIRFAKVVVGQ